MFWTSFRTTSPSCPCHKTHVRAHITVVELSTVWFYNELYRTERRPVLTLGRAAVPLPCFSFTLRRKTRMPTSAAVTEIHVLHPDINEDMEKPLPLGRPRRLKPRHDSRLGGSHPGSHEGRTRIARDWDRWQRRPFSV